jgi:hypothetical protein
MVVFPFDLWLPSRSFLPEQDHAAHQDEEE